MEIYLLTLKFLIMKKLSILGLCLLVVSAVIASITPSKKSVNNFVADGHVSATSNDDVTCKIGGPTGQQVACQTTNDGAGDSTGGSDASGTQTTAGPDITGTAGTLND